MEECSGVERSDCSLHAGMVRGPGEAMVYVTEGLSSQGLRSSMETTDLQSIFSGMQHMLVDIRQEEQVEKGCCAVSPCPWAPMSLPQAENRAFPGKAWSS